MSAKLSKNDWPLVTCPTCRGAGKAGGWFYVHCGLCAGFGAVPVWVADVYLSPPCARFRRSAKQ